jgi:hypothetical protein
MSTEPEFLASAKEERREQARESNTLRVIGWFSVGMAVAALGIYLGSELRSRYKFKRRTPTTSTRTPANSRQASLGWGSTGS